MTESSIKKYAIIVAGGSGTRMNAPVPKQFLKLEGRPVLFHTISKFEESNLNINIMLVLSSEQLPYWEQLCSEYNFHPKITIAESGETRFHSVKNGLSLLDEEGIVAIHDAVRPLVSIKTIATAFKAAEMYGNAVPAVPLNDSIRQIDSTLSIALDRTKYCIIQTPQCFSLGIIKKAYQQDYKYTYTDDATVVEAIGEKIHLIDGNPDNIKITTPKDLVIAEALLKNISLNLINKNN